MRRWGIFFVGDYSTFSSAFTDITSLTLKLSYNMILEKKVDLVLPFLVLYLIAY